MIGSKRVRSDIIIAVIFVVFILLLSNIFANELIYSLASVLVIIIGTMYIIKDVIKRNRFEVVLIFIAYFVRIILIISDIYFNDFLNVIRMGGNDSDTFFLISQYYFNGDFEIYLTKYPYLLNIFYHIFGFKRIVPQYINVFCWYLCWRIIRRFLKDCGEKQYRIMTFLFCFMPASICITSELLRESIMMLFIVLSFYYLWKWMNSGKLCDIIFSFLLSVPAVILHMASFALWAGIPFIYIFWNYRSQKWKITKGKIFIAFAGFIAIFFFFYFRIYSMFGYLPNELSLENITNRPFVKGRADYLVGVSASNIPQFIFWTIIRGIYFWFSPIIFDWSSLKDILGVVTDVIPILYIMIITCRKRFHEYINHQYIAGIVILLLYTFIYAWGVGNAGGAMRHRNMLLGLLIMTYGIRHLHQDDFNSIPRTESKLQSNT